MELKTTYDTISFMPLMRNTRNYMSLKNDSEMYELKKPATKKDTDIEKIKLREAARGFEAIFIKKLLSSMRSTMSEGNMFGNGVAGDIYGEIVDTAVAEELSKNSILGLADNMYRIMVKSIDAKANQIDE
ncbi:MAG: rod-binding protein [Candidatus Latescibacteria bacterium]|nr:rod-binding protein [Candidatus Latescibacterota bacterium]